MMTTVLSENAAAGQTTTASLPATRNHPALDDRFPSRLTALEEVPEPLRGAVCGLRPAPDRFRLLLFGPASRLAGQRASASLLAITDTGWLLARDAENGRATVAQGDFANTLRVELTCILLYGRLRIDFAVAGRADSTFAEFNTVYEDEYRQAVQRLLDGMNGVPSGTSADSPTSCPLPESLPMKFRHAISRYQPVGQALRRVVYWPDVMQANRRWWQRPLADEGLLALTDRTLTLMTGEPQRSWFRARAETRYGYVITYCPLCRLAGATWSAEGMIASLELALRNPQGGETLSINLPQCRSADVNALVREALDLRSSPPAQVGNGFPGVAHFETKPCLPEKGAA